MIRDHFLLWFKFWTYLLNLILLAGTSNVDQAKEANSFMTVLPRIFKRCSSYILEMVFIEQTCCYLLSPGEECNCIAILLTIL